MWPRFKAKFIGDRAFYKMALILVIPVIVQNTVTNFVNLLDNVMVGSLGTAHMSGVSIANHLMFVFNLSIFGRCLEPAFTVRSWREPKTGRGFRKHLRF